MATILGVKSCAKCAHSFQDGPNQLCRFNPPVAQPIIVNTPQGPQVAGWVSGFPPINENMHCGQFKVGLEIASARDTAAHG